MLFDRRLNHTWEFFPQLQALVTEFDTILAPREYSSLYRNALIEDQKRAAQNAQTILKLIGKKADMDVEQPDFPGGGYKLADRMDELNEVNDKNQSRRSSDAMLVGLLVAINNFESPKFKTAEIRGILNIQKTRLEGFLSEGGRETMAAGAEK